MKPLFPICGAIVAFLGGCAHSIAPTPPFPSDPRAAEDARREERLKIMQQVWADQTGANGPEGSSGRPREPALEYPAGNYSGINFGSRLAPDPSLAEPDR